MRPAWLYILHFESKLHHAGHYAGSSIAIRRRIQSHREGRGARLTQVLGEKGIGWRVAVVMQCDAAERRRLERKLKDRKKTRLFCPLCTTQPRSFPGCIPVPFEE